MRVGKTKKKKKTFRVIKGGVNNEKDNEYESDKEYFEKILDYIRNKNNNKRY